MVTPDDEDLVDDGPWSPEVTLPEVDVNPVEPWVLFGPDGEELSRSWPGVWYLAP